MIFKSMFSPALGWVNYALGLDLGWFESRETALASCLLLTIWMGIGFDFLLFQSALRGIPGQLLEAAELDSTGFWSLLFRIKLPLISPTISSRRSSRVIIPTVAPYSERTKATFWLFSLISTRRSAVLLNS